MLAVMAREAVEPDGAGAIPSIPSIYRDPRHYDLLAEMTAPGDLPFYRRWLDRYGGPVLELGCGTGRVCLPLARAGAQVWGIDVARPLLEHARAKATAAAIPVTLLEADCRAFELGRPFQLILLPYNALNHLLDLDAVAGCLGAVRRHLKAQGRFVIDTFNPDLGFLSRDPELKVVEYLEPDSGERVILIEQNRYDAARQINHITWRYQVGGRADQRVDELDMRIFFPQELDALLELHGFEIEHKLGDYDERPFGAATPKQLLVCRLRGGD